MKLALCLEYPIGQPGGTEVLVSELIRGFAQKHQVTLVSLDDESSLEKTGLRSFLAGHITLESYPVTADRSFRLAQELADLRIDLAHFHFGGNYGWRNRTWWQCPITHLARRGIPCLSTNHGAFAITDGYCGPQRSASLKLALLPPAWLSKQIVLSHLDCEVAVSQHDYDALRRWYWPMRGKFRQIYHSRLAAVPPVSSAERDKIILCVGGIGLRKGQTYLTEAFSLIASKHRDWKLVLVGRPVNEELVGRIRQLISANKLQDRVRLVERCSDEELRLWLRRAAIFGMPSLMEGLGLSLQEALAYGCACIGSRVGGIPDLIQDGDNGLLVEPANVSQLAGALGRVIEDKQLRNRFAQRGPQSIAEKEMTAPQMVKKYDNLYQATLRESVPSPARSGANSRLPNSHAARN